MIKKYLKLTKEQKARGVYFSSEFVGQGVESIRHEITNDDYNQDPKEAEEKEALLRNDRFFRGWGQDSNNNVIHEIRS